jgi:hypothetical protein
MWHPRASVSHHRIKWLLHLFKLLLLTAMMLETAGCSRFILPFEGWLSLAPGGNPVVEIPEGAPVWFNVDAAVSDELRYHFASKRAATPRLSQIRNGRCFPRRTGNISNAFRPVQL